MARPWTAEENENHRKQLHTLYVVKNKTIAEIGHAIGLSEQGVFKRLQRLGIASTTHLKPNYLRKKKDIHIPHYSADLAEFFGIMLGDGHVSHFQTLVTLGTKELLYVEYVASLMQKLFETIPSISIRKTGYRDVYIGSVVLTAWLRKEGLVSHKVLAQVGVPAWILKKKVYMESFLRGFFDTDGSVYKLRFGVQLSFTNKSIPLLRAVHHMLGTLGYRPSVVGKKCVYVTKRTQVERFFVEVKPANIKHRQRFEEIMKRVGTEVVKRDAL